MHLLRGNFALAVYDTRRRRLWLARDALGTRALYYSASEGRLFFGTLIVPLLEAPGVSREPDPAALSAFLRAGMVPAPRTLFRDVRKLAPGQWLLADESGVRVEQYWAPVLADADRPVSAAVAARECGRMLDEWVAGCLSQGNEGVAVLVDGGFGSALIASAAANQGGGAVGALAVAFDDSPKTRELALARRLGGAPGFEIVEERLSSIEAERVLQEVVGRLAEPPASRVRAARRMGVSFAAGIGASSPQGGWGGRAVWRELATEGASAPRARAFPGSRVVSASDSVPGRGARLLRGTSRTG